MRVQVLSDVHVEYMPDHGRRLIDSLDPTGVDVLVLAGDVGDLDTFGDALVRYCRRYAGATVVHVLGNHEYYGGGTEDARKVALEVAARCPNYRLLDDGVLDMDGVRFVGSTLWFRDAPGNWLLRGRRSEFRDIRGFDPWVYGQNAASETFLTDQLQTGRVDVAVTHYLPSARCIAPKYRDSKLNHLVMSPVADEVPPDYLPQLWIYGHSHEPGDAVHHGCRFLSNARGYPGEQRASFCERLVVEVSPR
jgi:predicted phosphodiesterase